MSIALSITIGLICFICIACSLLVLSALMVNRDYRFRPENNFDASGKPEEGEPESVCKHSTEPAGRPANPEAEVSTLPCVESKSGGARRGVIHREAEPLTPTTGPLASFLSESEHNKFPNGRW